jgi:hypothetical protein
MISKRFENTHPTLTHNTYASSFVVISFGKSARDSRKVRCECVVKPHLSVFVLNLKLPLAFPRFKSKFAENLNFYHKNSANLFELQHAAARNFSPKNIFLKKAANFSLKIKSSGFSLKIHQKSSPFSQRKNIILYLRPNFLFAVESLLFPIEKYIFLKKSQKFRKFIRIATRGRT